MLTTIESQNAELVWVVTSKERQCWRAAGQGVGAWAELCRTGIAVGAAGQCRGMTAEWWEGAEQQ